jgi:hypothetical protein
VRIRFVQERRPILDDLARTQIICQVRSLDPIETRFLKILYGAIGHRQAQFLCIGLRQSQIQSEIFRAHGELLKLLFQVEKESAKGVTTGRAMALAAFKHGP